MNIHHSYHTNLFICKIEWIMSEIWESCISVAFVACLDVFAAICVDFGSIREWKERRYTHASNWLTEHSCTERLCCCTCCCSSKDESFEESDEPERAPLIPQISQPSPRSSPWMQCLIFIGEFLYVVDFSQLLNECVKGTSSTHRNILYTTSKLCYLIRVFFCTTAMDSCVES